MDITLKGQLISLGITLALLAVSCIAFHEIGWTGYVLIGIAGIELIQLILTLIRHKKMPRTSARI